MNAVTILKRKKKEISNLSRIRPLFIELFDI